jgi:exonuclease SbcC
MRPHRLHLSAFGPFPGVVEVDLDQLSSGGLFLLQGPTGAGKTTLLDGLCFALYGRVPGARGVARLRSDHAPADVPCSASLEVTVAGRRLRVTRTPTFTRPKKRGDGLVEEKATARLEELRGGEWRTVSTRPDEVGAELEQLLGMSADQFWQVVLLPQGLFAEFLRAGAKERGALLETLFRTDRFRDAETWLAERRRLLRERFDTVAGEARALVARVAEAAQVDEPDADPDIAWYDEVLAAVEAAVTATTADAVAGDAAVAQTSEMLRAAERLADRQRRRREAERTVTDLAAARPEIDAVRAGVEAARRAAPLLPVADHADDVAAALAQTESEAGRLAASVGVRPDDDLTTLADLARARIGLLDGLRDIAAQLADNERRLAEAASTVATLDERTATVTAEQAAMPALVTAATARRAAGVAATTALPAARGDAERLATLAAENALLAELRTRLDQQRRADDLSRAQSLTCQEQRLTIWETLLAGQAARLASELVDGMPCAVCGSADHPHPAAGSDLVDETALAEAEKAARRAADEHRRAGAAVASTAADVATVEARLAAADWSDTTGLEAARAEADTRAEELAAAAADLADAEAALAACADQERALAKQLATIGADRAAAAEARDLLAENVARDRDLLTHELEGAPSLDAALAATRTLADALDATQRTRAEAARLTREAASAATALAAALAEHGFATVGDLRAAAADASRHEQVEAYDIALAAATASLADPDLDVPLEPAADIASAGAADAVAREARDAARDAATVASSRLRAVAGHAAALRRAVSGIAPLRTELAETEQLAELAAGRGSSNRLGMSLSTYVLAARLEEVAVAASQRLVRMSDGRFTLRHSDARADGRRRSGLGLTVHDAWTGQSRDTGTLSGGETFMASLALALGLADTVTAESGGAPIEALFVDEGFGTLDENSLEEVMDVLDGLRAGGRVVGVVSHVTDLRQRIPNQLRVHKGRTGSTLETVA